MSRFLIFLSILLCISCSCFKLKRTKEDHRVCVDSVNLKLSTCVIKDLLIKKVLDSTIIYINEKIKHKYYIEIARSQDTVNGFDINILYHDGFLDFFDGESFSKKNVLSFYNGVAVFVEKNSRNIFEYKAACDTSLYVPRCYIENLCYSLEIDYDDDKIIKTKIFDVYETFLNKP